MVAAKLQAGETAEITCADGPATLEPSDVMIQWKAPEGWTISGDGADVMLTAPHVFAASGTVKVTATDPSGDSDSAAIDVSTAANQAPEIES